MPKYLLILLLCLGISSAFATILIYGDTRNHPDVHRALVSKVQNIPVDAVFYTGDMNQKGRNQSEYDSFKEIISPLKAPFYPVRGNHEKDLDLYLKNFPLPEMKSYYSLYISRDSLHCIVLDSNLDILPGSAQYKWLVKELNEAQDPVILYLHHPVFSSGYHGDELGLQLFMPNLLAKYRIAAVISGHEHSFEHLRYKGLDYFVSGGGGAPLREQDQADPNSVFFRKTHHYNLLSRKADTLVWQSYDLDGKLLYETQIELSHEK